MDREGVGPASGRRVTERDGLMIEERLLGRGRIRLSKFPPDLEESLSRETKSEGPRQITMSRQVV